MDSNILYQIESVKNILEESIEQKDWSEVQSATELIQEIYYTLDRASDGFGDEYDYD